MSVYIKSNLTNNLLIIDEIWISDNKAIKKKNWIGHSGFGVKVF